MCYSVFAYGSKEESSFETNRPGGFTTGFTLTYCTISQCSLYLIIPNSERLVVLTLFDQHLQSMMLSPCHLEMFNSERAKNGVTLTFHLGK